MNRRGKDLNTSGDCRSRARLRPGLGRRLAVRGRRIQLTRRFSCRARVTLSGRGEVMPRLLPVRQGANPPQPTVVQRLIKLETSALYIFSTGPIDLGRIAGAFSRHRHSQSANEAMETPSGDNRHRPIVGCNGGCAPPSISRLAPSAFQRTLREAAAPSSLVVGRRSTSPVLAEMSLPHRETGPGFHTTAVSPGPPAHGQ